MKTLDQFLNERLGGKGYKPYTSLTGKKVSGDWEDSDRGAGNKAKKRAGGKVEKKSPTYQAYVLNKEDVNEGAGYKTFMKNVQDAKDRVKKKTDERKKKDVAYVDRVKKGIRFYDKKGKGHIRGGKKVYD